MTLANPNDLNFSAIKMLARELTCDLNAAGGTEKSFFTIPTATSAVWHHVCMHTFSADTANAVVTFGKTGGTCDEFLGDQTLSGITASYATQVLILMPVPAATTVVAALFTAAQVLAMEITTAAGGACTCTVEVWGHLF